MDEHYPECTAPRCPDCGSTDVHPGPFIDMRWCNECQVGADADEFVPVDCTCDELRASRMIDQMEADAEFIGGLDRD